MIRDLVGFPLLWLLPVLQEVFDDLNVWSSTVF